MCQLTLLNIRENLELRKILALNITLKNSEKVNQDGVGFFTTKFGCFRHPDRPGNILNYGKILNLWVEGTEPLLLHVRQATATNGVKAINEANTHPFSKEYVVVAHNGSLVTKDPETMKEDRFKEKIDSEIFAIILNETISNNREKPFFDNLQAAYSLFEGKFAFLLYDRVGQQWYVSRGETANLFFSRIYSKSTLDSESPSKYEGWAINTDSNSLEEGILSASNQMQIVADTILTWDKPTLLKENTTFTPTTDGLTIVGEMKENKRPVVATIVDATGDHRYQSWYGGYEGPYRGSSIPLVQSSKTKRSRVHKTDTISSTIKAAEEFLSVTGLGVDDLDFICKQLYGVWLCEVDEDTLLELRSVMFDLEKEYNRNGGKRLQAEYMKLLNGDKSPENVKKVFDTYKGLQYPYILNPVEYVKKLVQSQTKENVK
jgi:predicted glutamine amidotransferase